VLAYGGYARNQRSGPAYCDLGRSLYTGYGPGPSLTGDCVISAHVNVQVVDGGSFRVGPASSLHRSGG